MAGEQVVTEIIVDARQAKAGVLEYTEALSHAGEATDQFGNKISGGFSKAEKAADMYLARLDPAFNASQKLGRETATISTAIDGLERQMMRGAITTDVYNQRMTLLAGRMTAVREASTALAAGTMSASNAMSVLATGADTHARALSNVGDTSRRVGFAMRDLAIQSQDFFVQLASGANPMTAFIQQGSQVVQVNQNMGVSFRQMATAIGAMVASLLTNPWVLFVAAIVAVTGGIAAFLVASESAERRLLSMQTALRATRTDFEAMGIAATNAAKAVSQSGGGINLTDASAAAKTIAGATNFRGTQQDLEALIRTAGDLATVMGVKMPDAAKTLATAMDEPSKVAKELGEKHFPGMSNSLIETIRRMEAAGDAAGGYARLMEVLRGAVDGAREQSLTPLQQLLDNISAGFSTLGSNIMRVINDAIGGLQRLIAAAQKGREGEAENPLLEPFPMGAPPPDFASPEARAERLRRAVPEFFEEQAGLPTPPIPPFGGSNANRVNQAMGMANDTFNASKQGQIAAWNDKITLAKKALEDLGATGVKTGAEVDRLNNSIKLNQEAIDKASKGTAAHKTELEKLEDKLATSLLKTNEAADSQDKLAEAYKAGGAEVIHLTAQMKAQTDLITAGMKPGMEGWAKALDEATAANERLARSTGGSKLEESINKINQQADAQLKINAAFDGSEESITHATNAQKAYADAVAAGIAPGDQFNDVVAREAAALDRASEATQNLADQRRALSELSSMFTRAFSTISDAIVNAMFAGKDAVIDFGRIAKAIAQQVMSAFLQLAVLNPLLNALFGQRNLTLTSALGALGGGGGGTDMLGNAITVAGVGNQLSGGSIFSSLGITGENSLLSGATGFLVGTAPSTNAALAGLGPGVFGPATSGQLAASGTEGLIGSGGALSGTASAILGTAGAIGGGVGLGSLAGGFVASASNKASGPNPMIGAAIGAGIGALLGPIGALAGGLIGGALGGLIGPRPASPFSSLPLSIAGGQLVGGSVVSQGVDTSAMSTDARSNIGWLNAVLGAHAVNLAGLGGATQIGTNTPGGFQDPTKFASFGAAFPSFRFTADDPRMAAGIGGRSFANVQQLSDTTVAVEQFIAVMDQTKAADRITDFLNTLSSVATADIPAKLGGIVTFITDTVPKLLGEQNIGSLNAAVAQITTTFAPAIQMAQELSYKEAELTSARDKQVAAAIEVIQSQEAINNQGLRVRYATGLAQITGDTAQVAAAQLQAFDLNAEQQRMQMSQHLKEVYGETIAQTQYYADVMGLLEQALGVERIAVQKQFNATSVDVEKQRLEAMRSMQQLESRYQTARAQVTGSPQDAFAAQIYAFDIQAQAAHTDMSQQLIAALVGGQDFANRMAALEKALGVERLAIVTQFNRQMTAAWESNFRIAENLATRRVNAMATLGQVTPQQAQLYSFDVSARQQRVDLTNQLVSSFGEAYKATADYAARSAQLEQTLADERLAIQKQFNDQATNAATGVITSLAEYARGLQFSAATPLSPQAQYAQATSQFNAVSGAAIAGDFTSIQKLQSFSDAFLNASRGVYGSGAGYAADFQRVINALNAVGSIQPDTMTAAVYTAEMRTQTQQLVDSQSNLAKLLQSILTSLEQGKNAPARAAA